MAFDLRRLLGLSVPQQHQAAPRQAPRQQEDDAIVDTPQGQMPLSSVPAGGPWQQPQRSPQVAGQFTIPQIHQVYSAANNPVGQFGDISGGIDIQGAQNPGFIPVQGSQINQRKPLRIQNPTERKLQY